MSKLRLAGQIMPFATYNSAFPVVAVANGPSTAPESLQACVAQKMLLNSDTLKRWETEKGLCILHPHTDLTKPVLPQDEGLPLIL